MFIHVRAYIHIKSRVLLKSIGSQTSCFSFIAWWQNPWSNVDVALPQNINQISNLESRQLSNSTCIYWFFGFLRLVIQCRMFPISRYSARELTRIRLKSETTFLKGLQGIGNELKPRDISKTKRLVLLHTT